MHRLRDESGLALATVLVVILMLSMFTALLLREAVTQRQQAEFQAREDVVVAGAEAMLERYAAKLTIDPLYFAHWVDESERARVCQTAASSGYGQPAVQPGNPWPWPDCEEWTYEDPDRDGDGNPDTDWYVHPILDGTLAESRDDIGVLMEVYPPAGKPLEVLVVGKRGDRIHRRAISATVQATALSEFYRVTENDLAYGSNRETWGKVYSGGDVTYGSNGKAHADVFAEDRIVTAPQWLDGAEGWQSTPTGSYNNIRDAYPQPLDFNDFWDDLDTLQSAACSGDGLCLNDANARGWRIHPFVLGGVGKLRVCKSTTNQSETWWWTNGQSAQFNTCTTYDIPANGAVWANQHVVIGDNQFTGGTNDNRLGPDAFSEAILKGSLTIYAGTVTDKKNIILNADTTYDDPNSFDVLGLIASDEVIIYGGATGTDKKFYINAALLGQYDRWIAVGPTPYNSTLITVGSIATRSTGDISGEFSSADYGFDELFEFVRPPFYPLIVNDWSYQDWTELPLPSWATP
ncbi:MAG: hypothetical protein ACXW1Y_04600 [Acidimicrobiia bacterium]